MSETEPISEPNNLEGNTDPSPVVQAKVDLYEALKELKFGKALETLNFLLSEENEGLLDTREVEMFRKSKLELEARLGRR